MSEVTKPLMLDETGQAIVEAIKGVSLGNYVIVNINNYTWGSVSGAGVYPVGAPVTLRATPKDDCYFLAWRNADGDVISINPEITFTPSGNTVIQADFNNQEFVKIVSWADGTDVELNAMLQAHYDGVIDIYDYWHVGDTRTVHHTAMPAYQYETTLSETHEAQDVNWVLMDTDMLGYYKVNQNDEFSFAVGMEDCLLEKGKMKFIESLEAWKNWDDLLLRKPWANTIFYDSMPQIFKSLFKKFKVGELSTYEDYFQPFSGWNIAANNETLPAHHRPVRGELRQFEYYENSEKRIKHLGIDGESISWFISNYNGNNPNFWDVTTINGTFYDEHSQSLYGLSMFGII